MFRIAIASKYHLTVPAGLLLLAVSAITSAAAPATDLGKNQPNTPDSSLLAPWHVYVFHRDNVEYVQINDANHNVRAAFANANGQTLVLPMGADNERVSSVQPSTTTQQSASAAGNTVYRDNQVQVVMATQPTGTAWIVQPISKTAAASGCSAEICTGISNSK